MSQFQRNAGFPGIIIHTVANGYMVRPTSDFANDRSTYVATETRVFETFDALTQWMRANLTTEFAEGK